MIECKTIHAHSGGAGPVSSSKWDGMALILSGRSAYRPTRALQQALWERRRRLELPDTLILVEHDPVITIGRHGDPNNILLPERQTPEVVHVDRGGEVTYHGPGQITAYWIADLRAHELGVRRFVADLEEAVIGTLSDFGIAAFRRKGLIGVWVRANQGTAKIAAVGVRIARGVSIHGIALNVGPCLDGFRGIIPCGLQEEGVTTMESALGGPVDQAAVGEVLVQRFGEVFASSLRCLRDDGIRVETDLKRVLGQLERAAARGARKPKWLRMDLPSGRGFASVRHVLRSGALRTVCEAARCPNRQECWSAGTATFMILGSSCTRACRFCAIGKDAITPPDPAEPSRVAHAAKALGLRHVVVTSVTRDDLPDGGAEQFAAVIREIRKRLPGSTVEVLIPDFAGSSEALDRVFLERPEILNHNIETAARLYPPVRPGADYNRSLAILRRAAAAGLSPKSGFMVGLGESEREILELLEDLRKASCERVTIGQYLQPCRGCLPVKRYWTPEEFLSWRERALEMGFVHVESGPLVRSSYRAAAAVANVSRDYGDLLDG